MRFTCCLLILLCMALLGASQAQNAGMMGALTEMLNATTAAIGGSQTAEKAAEVSLNRAALSALNDPVLENPADEQTRLNTLRRTFLNLPATELEQYQDLLKRLEAHGVQNPIEADSELAEALQKAWEHRQQELNAAMDTMVKPVELMTQLIDAIRADKRAQEEEGRAAPADANPGDKEEWLTRAVALEQLQDILDDVDNARDFHTVGGFEALAAVLDPSGLRAASDEEQGLAALALGNAVKNQYDFQQWVLERNSGPSLLERLLRLLVAGSEPSRRRALYALSSAARGNLDVQAALCELQVAEPALSISSILLKQKGGPELQRKILAFAADMLEEYTFIQQALASPSDLADPQLSGEEAKMHLADTIAQLKALQPIGAHFCCADWARAGFDVLAVTTRQLQAAQDSAVSLDGTFTEAAHHGSPVLRAVVENAVTMLHKLLACPQLPLQATARERLALQGAAEWARRAGDSAGDVLANALSLLESL